jgi:UDP-N-acetylmuramoyl-tripeptide--D-alanyl-D-alanine ligase
MSHNLCSLFSELLDRHRMRILAASLRPFARAAFRKHQTPVVAITGSVGKSTTTEFVGKVLASRLDVIRTAGNYNDSTGVPTTILGVKRVKTFTRFANQLPRILYRTYVSPQRGDYFVLEVSAGGIRQKLTMFTPSITIVTAIAPSHLEMFGSVEGIIEEKVQLVEALPETGYAVLCYDDLAVRGMAHRTRSKTVFYGFDPKADVWMDAPLRVGGGLATTLHDAQGEVRLFFPHLVNRYHLLAVMASWCVGTIAGLPRETLSAAVQDVVPRRGRGSTLEGPRGSVLFDDAFNANPASMAAAFDTFQALAGDRRRIAILGDMLEMGPDAGRYHREVGRQAVDFADVVIGVGDHARAYVSEFTAARPGAPGYHCRDIDEAFEVVKKELRSGDAVLLKGSHGIGLQDLIPRIQSLN